MPPFFGSEILCETFEEYMKLVDKISKKCYGVNKMEKNRKLACEIVELFEDLLDKKGIEIPCDDELESLERHFDGNEAKLYGMEFWTLVDDVESILNEEFGK